MCWCRDKAGHREQGGTQRTQRKDNAAMQRDNDAQRDSLRGRETELSDTGRRRETQRLMDRDTEAQRCIEQKNAQIPGARGRP